MKRFAVLMGMLLIFASAAIAAENPVNPDQEKLDDLALKIDGIQFRYQVAMQQLQAEFKKMLAPLQKEAEELQKKIKKEEKK